MTEINQQTNPSSEAPSQIPSSKERNTGMAILAYFLFFIPLLTEAKKDPFVKYHIKQGLLIFIGWIAVSIVSWILPWQLGIIATLLDICVLVLMIIGIMNAAKGKEKPLPIIGKFGEQFKF